MSYKSSVKTSCRVKKGWFGSTKFISQGLVSSENLEMSSSVSSGLGDYIKRTNLFLYDEYNKREAEK
jgi:hypothetical protein